MRLHHEPVSCAQGQSGEMSRTSKWVRPEGWSPFEGSLESWHQVKVAMDKASAHISNTEDPIPHGEMTQGWQRKKQKHKIALSLDGQHGTRERKTAHSSQDTEQTTGPLHLGYITSSHPNSNKMAITKHIEAIIKFHTGWVSDNVTWLSLMF